jgi:hypothetical protein
LLAHELVDGELANTLDLVQSLILVPQPVELARHLPAQLIGVKTTPHLLTKQWLRFRMVRSSSHCQEIGVEEVATDELDQVDLKPALHLP